MADRSNVSWHLRAEQLASQGSETVIAAGFPCQDLSLAGKGAGLAGARSGLVWPLLRTIRLVRPRFAVLENVAALLSRGLDAVLGRLAEIGYDTEWHCIPASAVGAPHQRDRIWIVAADAGSEQHEGNSTPLSGSIAAQLSRAFADTYGEDIWQQSIGEFGSGSSPVTGPDGAQEPMADADFCERQPDRAAGRMGRLLVSGEDEGNGLARRAHWAVEPDVGRVADGVPARVDRLKALGNAVVPQIPEIIGKAIMSASAHVPHVIQPGDQS